MIKNLGYKKSLFILPFDHRVSFTKKMFGVDDHKPPKKAVKQTAELKQIIYEGFKLTVGKKISKESAGILVDEQTGDKILKDAIKNGYNTSLPVEKSGQKEFDFEYGAKFGQHIKKYKPTIVKVLIRYNIEGNQKLNVRQEKKLKKLSDWCHDNNHKFMIEALVPATDQQLKSVDNDKLRYDLEIRPKLMVKMVAKLQAAGIEPDIWKVEGLQKATDYKKVVNRIRADGRDNVGTIVLGRGLDDQRVEKWIRIAGGIDGMIGFAVGRTIFWQPLVNYKEGKITKKQAAEKISQKYYHFYQIFTGQK